MAYLDYNATTPSDPRVVEAMLPTLTRDFGNPSSTTHDTGMNAESLIDEARQSVAAVAGLGASDVIFTSGATEANNMVFAGAGMGQGRGLCVLYGATEHKSVTEACIHMGGFGLEAREVPVGEDGTMDTSELERLLGEGRTHIVSAMAANGETGVINPMCEISKIAHEHGALLHCDAVQMVGKMPFDAGDLGIDIVTLSGHKIYGPKGCGAVVATREGRRMIGAVVHGGGQENGMRSGTPNVPGIVGFGEACRIISEEGLAESRRQESLRDGLERRIVSEIPDVSINGAGAPRLPNTSNMRIAGALADAVIVNARGVEISTGSACSSGTMEPSHVLTAMGLDSTAAGESIRISLGRPSTIQDVDLAVSYIAEAAKFVRRLEAVEMAGGAGSC